MKDYELTVLFHPDLEMNLDPAITKVKKILTSNGGNITKEENDGKKRLAYRIKGLEYAMFYYIDVSLPSESLSKVSSAFNITDEIIRSLLVRVDERKAKLAARREAALAAKGESKNDDAADAADTTEDADDIAAETKETNKKEAKTAAAAAADQEKEDN